MNVIKTKIEKDEMKEMPKAFFPGEIHVISTPVDADKAIAYLKNAEIVGIDSETRPSFTKGQTFKVALLQISSAQHCFLFRLNQTGLTPSIISLLESDSLLKVGLSLKDDFLMLHKRAPFEAQNYIELQNYVSQYGILDKSLQKIYAILFQEKISKSQRLSNWEATSLTDAQKQYAAMDAWACLRIYQCLQELNASDYNQFINEISKTF